MGYKTVSDLDELEWQVWPKTPTFLYVDITDNIRISKDTLKESRGIKTFYAIRIDHDGPFGADVVRHLTKAMAAFELTKINKWLPCLPLKRTSPYEAVEL